MKVFLNYEFWMMNNDVISRKLECWIVIELGMLNSECWILKLIFNHISHWSFVAIEIAFNRIRNIREYRVFKTIKGLWNTKKDLNHIRNIREYKVLKFEMLLNLECWTTNIECWNCNCYWSLTRVRDSGGILFKRRLRNSKSTFKKIQRIARPERERPELITRSEWLW